MFGGLWNYFGGKASVPAHLDRWSLMGERRKESGRRQEGGRKEAGRMRRSE